MIQAQSAKCPEWPVVPQFETLFKLHYSTTYSSILAESKVPGFVGPRRHNGDAVKLCHLQVGAIQVGLIAAGTSDAGAGFVGDD